MPPALSSFIPPSPWLISSNKKISSFLSPCSCISDSETRLYRQPLRYLASQSEKKRSFFLCVRTPGCRRSINFSQYSTFLFRYPTSTAPLKIPPLPSFFSPFSPSPLAFIPPPLRRAISQNSGPEEYCAAAQRYQHEIEEGEGTGGGGASKAKRLSGYL